MHLSILVLQNNFTIPRSLRPLNSKNGTNPNKKKLNNKISSRTQMRRKEKQTKKMTEQIIE